MEITQGRGRHPWGCLCLLCPAPFMPPARYLAVPPGCRCCRPAGRRGPRGPRRWSSHPPAASAPCACAPHPPRAAASAGAGPCALGAAAADCSCPRGPLPGPHAAAHGLPAAPANREGAGGRAQSVGSGLTQPHGRVCGNFLLWCPRCEVRAPHTPKAGARRGSVLGPSLEFWALETALTR